jgi:hypothetical protein
MGSTKRNAAKGRLSLADRVELRLSTHQHVDGLWVGTWEAEAESVLRRVQEALDLIKSYDRMRYDRITRDLARVWVRTLFGALGQYNKLLAACELDVRFVLAATTAPEMIAATIVHEATHARLMRCGISYEEKLRPRVEAVCFRRELAFAKKLPDGEQVREHAVRMLEVAASNDYWTNTALIEQWTAGGIETLRHLGVPMWFARFAVAVGRRRLRRLWGREKSHATVIASEAKQSQPRRPSK